VNRQVYLKVYEDADDPYPYWRGADPYDDVNWSSKLTEAQPFASKKAARKEWRAQTGRDHGFGGARFAYVTVITSDARRAM
jgi:hypothetical protein